MLPAPELWCLSHKSLSYAWPGAQHPHGDGDTSKSNHAWPWVAWRRGKKRYTGADTFADGVIPARSWLFPFTAIDPSKKQTAAWMGLVPANLPQGSATPLWGDSFHHSEVFSACDTCRVPEGLQGQNTAWIRLSLPPMDTWGTDTVWPARWDNCLLNCMGEI